MACSSWHILPGTRKEELSLDFTLPTGQTFRWTRIVQAPEPAFEGVVGQRAVRDASSSACNALACKPETSTHFVMYNHKPEQPRKLATLSAMAPRARST